MAPLSNAAIAQALDELGDLYELDGAESYRVIAYRNAARSVRDAPVSVAEMVAQGRATELNGIGKTLDTKLRALVTDGEIPKAVELRAKFPVGLISVMHLPGFGPRRARRLYDELGIDSLDALRAAAEQGRIRTLRGFGAKVEEGLLKSLADGHDGRPAPRILLPRALALAEQIAGALQQMSPAPEHVEIAGSARRMTDSVKDVDLIATAADPGALVRTLAELPLIESTGAPGDNSVRATTHTGMSVDLQVVEPDQFGNVLQHLTGSKAHNVALREASVRRGLHVSQYGILDDATGRTIRCASEEEVYATLGYAWIPPELREGRGELEAAAAGGPGLPDLVTVEDLKGDLHCHTTASDGRNSVEQMAAAARDRGLEYLCITDHSASHGFGNAVSADELLRQVERVRELNAGFDDFELLIGTETNILTDGSVDYPDEVLAELDWVIASVHTSFGLSEAAMTARMVAAMEHPLVDAIGHPTGRKIETRPPYAVSVDRLIETAVRTGTMLEINSASDRRDLNEIYARSAAEAGVPILVDSDAHGVNTLSIVRWGVATARRAWLTAGQVANTRPWADFAPMRKRVRAS